MTAQKLNLGRINYLNCWPLFQQLPAVLESNHYNLISGHPARLNAGLENGEIDISPSSSMLLASADTDDYFILPDISIASLTEVRSVILLSRQPLTELNHKTISLTNHSLTSIFLLKIILFHFQKLDPDTITFTTGEFAPADQLKDAALVIGDQALKLYHSPPPDYIVYDLGKLWHQFTNLPFVYALWIGRQNAINKKSRSIIDLHRALTEIVTDLPDKLADLTVAAQAEVINETKISPSQLLSYWQQAISYDLNQQALAGLNLFYNLAYEMNLTNRIPKLNFFPAL